MAGREKKNERAFAIQAPPEVIWRILLEEVREGVESGRAAIVRQEAPRALVLDVRLGWGLRVRYDYALTRAMQHTEVAAVVAPYGMRHSLANIVSLGRGGTPYMLAITQGLANLKEAAEREARPGPR